MNFVLKSRGKKLKLDRPRIMGILNVTPDSFSDGGDLGTVEMAVQRAKEMARNGADILDIGGESTRPNSVEVLVEEELRRVIPVIKAVRKVVPKVWISVDTWKAEVAQASVAAGADMINDVTALRGDSNMVRVAEKEGVPICLMYSKDQTARTTLASTEYKDVMVTIKDFLRERIVAAGKAQVIVDPGMGAFVSTNSEYSYEILERLKELTELGCPILVGTSRKSFLTSRFGNKPPKERLEGSLITSLMAAINGAHILRGHDVKELRDVLFPPIGNHFF